MPPYQLTPEAEKDLEDIARYTLKTWGKRQALRYGELLEKRFQEIADRTALSRGFSNRFPQVFVNHCEHHYVFFLHPEGQPPLHPGGSSRAHGLGLVARRTASNLARPE